MARPNNAIKLIKVDESRHLIVTPKARVSFPQLFTPRAFMDQAGQKKEFRVDLIFDTAEQLKEGGKSKKGATPSILQALHNAKTDQWGTKENWPAMPFAVVKKGDENHNKEGVPYAGYAGKLYITAKSGEQFPPKIYLYDGREATEADIYGGCYAQAVLLARPYAFGKNFGVRLMLLQLRKLGDGDKLGGGVNNRESLFEEVLPEDGGESFGGTDDGYDF